MLRFSVLTLLLLLPCAGLRASVEPSTLATSAATDALPDAPVQVPPQAGSSLSGTVFDANGAPLAGARVTVSITGVPKPQVEVSSETGGFVFSGLAAGEFTITVDAPGMVTFTSGDTIQAGERKILPPTVLAVAGATMEVRVTASQIELAQEQVKAEEHQRAFGVVPNFYSSYVWDAAPLNARQKFDLALHAVADPFELVGNGLLAGIEQAKGSFPGYGLGAEGYAKRYGAAYTDTAVARMIGSAILPSLLHQDPRYFYKGSGSKRSRMLYAVSRAVVARGDNGKAEPNYSHVFGSFAAGGISKLYHPSTSTGVSLILTTGLIDTAGNAANNLIREFLLRRVTPEVPDDEKGDAGTP